MKNMGLVIGASLFFGTQIAAAHPGYIPGSCRVLDRNERSITGLNLDTAETLDFRAPLLLLGNTTVSCQGDLGPGALVILSFANTGDTCDLGPEIRPIAKTKDWTEVIKANGQTTLTCRFGPR